MKKFKNIFSVLLLLLTFVIVIILVFTRIQGKTPQLFGYRLLRVSSSSMEPKLEVGDIILSKSVDNPISLKVGDIITYNGEYGGYAGKLITHEIVSIPYVADGKVYVQTMGIANGYIDPEISEDQIVGIMVCKIPVLGAVFDFFMTPWGLVLILAFLAVLFVNEALVLKRAVKDSDSTANDDITSVEAETE